MRIEVPGDKSLTQRALILSALADGASRLSGLLWGGDADSTAGALRALGAQLPDLPSNGTEIQVRGVGLHGLQAPPGALDLGNSGTGTRLLLGVLAGSGLKATVTGDVSLSRRPMRRVTEPLTLMGARFEELGEEGCLPLEVHGAHPLRTLAWKSPVASAQVKSSILLAGLTGSAPVSVIEPRRSRDHTERMFGRVGAAVSSRAVDDGWSVELADPPDRIHALDFHVPGDISSAAFFLTLAVLGGVSEPLEIARVGLNPSRTAFLDVLIRMGARLDITIDTPPDAAEPMGTLVAESGPLQGTEIGAEEVPGLIDEVPLIAALASRADGVTRITGAEDLRHKESDRITAVVENLRALGVDAEELPDGLEVRGSDAPLQGSARTYGDHRIAMAFGVLGAVGDNDVSVDDPEAASVSFPGFWNLLRRAAS